MVKKLGSLSAILARNLKYFMDSAPQQLPIARALAHKAEIAPNTVSNFLNPNRRQPSTTKAEGAPTLDKIEKIAGALGCEPWELLHPDIELARRQRDFYVDAVNALRAQEARDAMAATNPNVQMRSGMQPSRAPRREK